jgi:DNA replication protein DnaC
VTQQESQDTKSLSPTGASNGSSESDIRTTHSVTSMESRSKPCSAEPPTSMGPKPPLTPTSDVETNSTPEKSCGDLSLTSHDSSPTPIGALIGMGLKRMTPTSLTSQQIAKQNEIALRSDAFNAAGVDPRHKQAKIDIADGHQKWNAYYARACGIVDEGGCLVFLGSRGNGKTQMAVELIRRACMTRPLTPRQLEGRDGPPNIARYLRAREIGMAIRESYRQGAQETERKAVEKFIEPWLLVIDECQERPDSDHETRTLTLIMDKRYGAMRPTIMIANSTAQEFADLVGKSVTDRIHEGGGVLIFDWPSFRRKQ